MRMAWEVERDANGMPLRMFWRGMVERAVGRIVDGHIVTKKGWLMAKDARAILWAVACAERKGRPFDAITHAAEPDAMDALEHAGYIVQAGEVGYYRLTDVGRRELPGQ